VQQQAGLAQHGDAVPVLPGFGLLAQAHVFGRQRLLRHSSIDPSGVRGQHGAGFQIGSLRVALAASGQVHAARQLVHGQRGLAQPLGVAPHGAAAQRVHLPQAVASVHVAQGKPGISCRLRTQMGNAPSVAPQLDALLEAVDAARSGWCHPCFLCL